MSKLFALLLGAALTLASAQPVIPYDSLMDTRVGIDGVIDNDDGREYPATYADKASGLTANWGFDDSLIYVGLVTKGRGWLALGRSRHARGEGRCVHGVVGVQDQAHVHRARLERVGLLAGEHVQEVGRHRQRRIGVEDRLADAVAVDGRHQR